MFFDEVVYPNVLSYSSSLPIITQKNDYSDINKTTDNNHYLITYNWNVYCPEKLNPNYFSYDFCLNERLINNNNKKIKFITAADMDTVLNAALVKQKIMAFTGSNLQEEKSNNIIISNEKDSLDKIERGALMEQ